MWLPFCDTLCCLFFFSRTCGDGTNGKATVGEGGGTREGGQVVRREEDEWNAGGRVIDRICLWQPERVACRDKVGK